MEALLRDMIAIDTQNPPGNEAALAEYIRQYLADAPCECSVQPIAPGRANVIARIRGAHPGRALVLNGHLDTVPNGANWSVGPREGAIRDGRLYGRGSSDMKSGLAVILKAFRELALSGKTPEHDVYFIGTCDEEAAGLGAQGILELGILHADTSLLIAEPTACTLGVAAKGCIWLRLKASGRSAHGAYPERGVNAIGLTMDFIPEINSICGGDGMHHRLLGRPSCTLTLAHGGTKANMVPDCFEAVLDIRTLPGMDHGEIIRRIRERAQAYCTEHPGYSLQVEVDNNRPAVETPADSVLAGKLRACHAQASGSAALEETGTMFFSDASILCRSGAADMVLFGPGRPDLAHVSDESVALADCQCALGLVRRLLDVV